MINTNCMLNTKLDSNEEFYILLGVEGPPAEHNPYFRFEVTKRYTEVTYTVAHTLGFLKANRLKIINKHKLYIAI